MDIIIKDARLITLVGDTLGIVKDGAVGIENNIISFVGKTKNLQTKDADVIIDGSKHVIMPGLVNAHIHTSMQLLRGAAQDLPEIEWMNKGIGPFAKHLKPEDIILGSKLGVLEALRTGTTTFSEYTRDVSNLVENVYLPFGARVVATETINEVVQTDRSLMKPTDLYEFDTSKGQIALKKNEALFSKYENEKLVSCLYGPQALDMVSLETLKEIDQKAKERDSKIHMHVAQGGRERLQIKGRFGNQASTIKILQDNNLLKENLIAVHCHDSTEQERELLVNKNSSMIGCPSSITMIDGIVPPVYHYHSIGGTVALGTDQAPGPGNHNSFREMRTISILSKAQYRDPTILPAWQQLKLVTIQGAKVLGLSDKIGSLEVGKAADIITIDLNKLLLTPTIDYPFHNFIPNLVYSATGLEVDNVIINGNPVILNNEFVNINEQEIMDDANERSVVIYAQAAKDWQKAESKMVEDTKKGYL